MACPVEQAFPPLPPLDAVILDMVALYPELPIREICDRIAATGAYTARSVRTRASWLRLFREEREASQ
jgi:hypothetical protein